MNIKQINFVPGKKYNAVQLLAPEALAVGHTPFTHFGMVFESLEYEHDGEVELLVFTAENGEKLHFDNSFVNTGKPNTEIIVEASDKSVEMTIGKSLEIVDRFMTVEELANSNQWKRYLANFGYEHLAKDYLARWGKYNAQFIVVTANPEHNYGLDFTIYNHYNADSINFMQRMSVGSSCIDSYGLNRVRINGNALEFSKQSYDKSGKSREGMKDLSKAGWIFGRP